MNDREYSAKELVEMSLGDEAELDQEELFTERLEKRTEWLAEQGLTDDDIMMDDVGEYIYMEEETGLRKVYLPSGIDLIF